jgi:hypothetical protein
MSQYAKAIVAVLGAAVTTLLALIPPETTLWIVLTVIAAALTAIGVYAVPNAPADTRTALYGGPAGQGPGGGG